MRKVLFASTAIATVAGAMAVANADVTLSGSVQWQYVGISDDMDNTSARASDSSFGEHNDITIAFSSTTDSGITMGLTQNLSDGGAGTRTSSISADFGTIEWTDGSGSAHAGSSYDVTAPGTSGGYGDAVAPVTSSGGAIDLSANEAVLSDSENGALNYHSPTFSGFSFGIGTSHIDSGSDNSSTSYGMSYAGSAGDVSYSVGYAAYDGVGNNEDGSHYGVNVSWNEITVGMGSSKAKAAENDEIETVSYGATYAVSSDLTVGIGQNSSENKMASGSSDDLKLEMTSIGVVYTIAPGLTASLASHSFDYKVGGTTDNDGSITQAELKMSF